MRKVYQPGTTEMEEHTDVDRISNLPWDVLDTILVSMPLKEAARTSILSSQWRSKWTGLSQFIINDACLPTYLSDKVLRWKEIMKIIQQVQSNHSGSIEKFELAAYCHPNHSDLEQWIQFLTEKGIKELILQELANVKRFKLPSRLFSCQQLSCLELNGCIVSPPPTFRGFNCLASLHLTHVSISSDTLEVLVGSCPVLERLMLLHIHPPSFLKINSLKLKHLKIDSQFQDICLQNAPLLWSVDIRLRIIPQRPDQVRACNLVGVIGCLHGIGKLILHRDFLEFLAYNVPERLPTMLDHLFALELREIRFESRKDVRVLFSLLGRAPNLEELTISVDPTFADSNPLVHFMKEQCLSGSYFNELKVVKIRGIWGTTTELEFIWFILAHSPVLEMMTIIKYRGERLSESLLRRVEWASKHVKVISLTL
ncbi:F-box/FBD/LRR-repeat protein At1g13570-like [Carya illinoinensis]|uniref:F-box/FBD/LRR-repeat protein At1g13570-like n=1 Tax=Carya illinoinensis TaxID=32201 RepID=UPI001C721360|nr:F-box/FBD/LRR-repeat protein At1g13570-like [Carya illinoinensis]XP_042977368.1 F-box/FBD/LRR-repeat protein At1g13570-like [Carya illinoinensis]